MGIENEFIVHLQDHLASQVFLFEFVEDADHGDLDHVGRRALDRGVDSISLCETSYGVVARIDITQVPSAAHQRFHIPVFPGKSNGLIHIFLDAGVFLKVGIDDISRLPPRDVQPLG